MRNFCGVFLTKSSKSPASIANIRLTIIKSKRASDLPKIDTSYEDGYNQTERTPEDFRDIKLQEE